MIRKHELGGVSIFIVIFTALLLTVVTTSFVQLMIRNQQQATNNDLSQSAYDAALAGVEDAKRALVRLSQCEDSTSGECNALRSAFRNNSQECEFLQSARVTTFEDGEVVVGDPSLNQAYTCVKVQLESQDVTGDLDANSGSKVIRLKAVNDRPIDKVRISWFTDEDADSQPLVQADPSFESLPADDGAWSEQTPSLLRAQLIQFRKGSISLNDFSPSETSSTTNALTAFLYPNVEFSDGAPTEPPRSGSAFWANDARLGRDDDNTNVPNPVTCDPDNGDSYYCSVTLTLPNPENGGRGNREAYLQLAALYNATHFKVELFNNNNEQLFFDGQQAVVDSTGRASALFRRVSARVSVKTPALKFPDAALSLEHNLCKNFTVTSRVDDYSSTCSARNP